MTNSKGGFERTALSKAPDWAMSSTMTKSSLSLGNLGWLSRIVWPFWADLTVVTTEWPRSRSTSST